MGALVTSRAGAPARARSGLRARGREWLLDENVEVVLEAPLDHVEMGLGRRGDDHRVEAHAEQLVVIGDEPFDVGVTVPDLRKP